MRKWRLGEDRDVLGDAAGVLKEGDRTRKSWGISRRKSGLKKHNNDT